MCFVPRSAVKAFHKCDSNWRPRSVVTVEGVPNRVIQVWRNACATVSAVLSSIGIASGQRVNRSMHVNMYTEPFERGNGPTRSMWTLEWWWSKQLQGPTQLKHQQSSLEEIAAI